MNPKRMMTTQEVATRYYQLAREEQLEKRQDELYAPDAVSIEPESDSQLPLEVVGLPAMRQKERQCYQPIEQMHGGFCNEPVVSRFHFACTMEMEVTMKGKTRRIKEQPGVFEVYKGKIVKEQFFYNDFASADFA